MVTRRAVKSENKECEVNISEQKRYYFKDIGTIEIKTYTLSISVTESDRDDVMLIDNTHYDNSAVGKVEHNGVSSIGGVLSFTQGKVIGGSILTVKGSVHIEVPLNMTIEFKLSSACGDIELCAPSSGELVLNNVSGKIRLCHGGDAVMLNTVSGGVSIERAYKTQQISAVSAKVETVCDKDSVSLDINSINGNISVTLPSKTDCVFNYSTLSGNISMDHSGSDSVKNPKLSVKITTICGAINISDKD